jgi:hypothetical protein
VSRWWAEQIRIVLHPEQVILLRFGKGRSRRVIQKQIVPCAPREADVPLWHSTLNTLEAALPQFCPQKTVASIVLSNHFVRYALINNSEQVSNATEEHALIQHHFARIYGTIATHWSMSINQAERPDRPRVACAVDQALIDALRGLFENGHIRLQSIQPYLMTVFNPYRNRFPQSAWLALVEDGILCLARLEDSQWRSIKCIKISDDWRRDLEIQLERETFLSGQSHIQAEQQLPVLMLAPQYPEPIDVSPAQATDPENSEPMLSILDPALWPEPALADGPVHAMALIG